MKKKPTVKKPAQKRKPLNDTTARFRMIAHFKEANPYEIARASRPEVQHFTSDGRGNIRKVDAPPKDGFFKQPREGRVKPITERKKSIKLKPEIWNGNYVTNFFRTHLIAAPSMMQKWSIDVVDAEGKRRKLTAEDQCIIMLAHSDKEIEVMVNHTYKYLDIVVPEDGFLAAP